jgi:preprotein translocase subunit SecY
VTLTAGTAFIMWLGEQITERGIGNGISLVIFSSIVIGVPGGIGQMVARVSQGENSLLEVLALLGFMVLVTGAVVFFERAQRRIPIQHARRVAGQKVQQGGMSYFPLRVNTAGVLPPIFASSILMFPLTIAQFSSIESLNNFITDFLQPGSFIYNGVYVGLIIFFAYFYTAIMINPTDVAENIKRSGGFIPGIRPGKNTADFIDRVLSRLVLVGGIYVSVVCIVPVILSGRFGIPFYFGGTALLIIVGVGLDTIGLVESHWVSRHYEGLVDGGRRRGRLGN